MLFQDNLLSLTNLSNGIMIIRTLTNFHTPFQYSPLSSDSSQRPLSICATFVMIEPIEVLALCEYRCFIYFVNEFIGKIWGFFFISRKNDAFIVFNGWKK